jgi:perosamine synthetase
MTASSSTRQQLALLGGEPCDIPASPQYPVFTELARKRVDEVLATGNSCGFSKIHPLIAEAENAVAAWQGTDYCLGTSSGHAALHACLIGLEITGGDEIVCTPYTWGASIASILHNNAVPVFADVDPETGLLDPASIEACITPRTRAIQAVHIYGQPANMTAIRAIADKHGLAVIEDGSQAHGARHAGRRVGSFGDAAGFSCNGVKLLATTESGYMVTNHDSVYRKAQLCTQHMGGNRRDIGRAGEEGFPSDLEPFLDSLVSTYRLTPLNAVLMTEQLKKVDEENAGRQANAQTLREELAGVKSVRMPDYPDGDEAVFYVVTLTFNPDHAGVSRDTYVAALVAEGLSASVYVREPIYRWKRLQRNSGAPRTMWDAMLAEREEAYGDIERPGVEFKSAYTFQLDFQTRYIEDPDAMKKIAAAFHKVEEQLPELQAYERANGR